MNEASRAPPLAARRRNDASLNSLSALRLAIVSKAGWRQVPVGVLGAETKVPGVVGGAGVAGAEGGMVVAGGAGVGDGGAGRVSRMEWIGREWRRGVAATGGQGRRFVDAACGSAGRRWQSVAAETTSG